MKILVVEDDSPRQNFFSDVLSEYTPTFVTTSVEAIELVKQQAFDLIFLDMDLDDGLERGLDVARMLKGTPNSYADVIVHSMNIPVAAQVQRILPGSQLLSIAEMCLIVARTGREAFIENILG